MIKKPKILHCPFNNGNFSWVLSRAERKLGFQSDLAVFYPHQFYPRNYDFKFNIGYLSFPNEWRRLKFLLWAVKNYDVFHFSYGSSILDHPFWFTNHLDFVLLKRYRKKIIVTYQGDDARQKDYFIENFDEDIYDSPLRLQDRYYDLQKRLRIKKVDKFAQTIFALNPDLLNVLPKRTRLLPYASIDISLVKPIYRQNKTLNIIHAPSDRFRKGTAEIIRIVKELSQDFPLKLSLVENMSLQKAWPIYQKADIAIDQIKVGWYGSFAVEMMALGKPVIAFLRKSDMEKYVPYHRAIPIVNAGLDELKVALTLLLTNQKLREKIGRKSRKYVEKYHNPVKIAKITTKEYLR